MNANNLTTPHTQTSYPLNKPWPWLIAIFFVFICLVWFGRSLDFSGYAHPDERNKISQVIDSNYNFNHPLLMLNSARVLAIISGKARDFESVKVIGRSVSVIYASLAVGVLALAMGRLYGRWVAIATGLFLMSNPSLFELAHYFKEEPTVLLGISLTILSMVVYSIKPTWLVSILCGCASGLAFSGKYAGIIVLPFALGLIIVQSRNKIRDSIFFLLAFVVIFLVINFPAILSLQHATGSLDREVVRLTGAGQEVKRNIPHGVYTRRYWETASPSLLFLLVIYFWGLVRNRLRLHPIYWAIALIPALNFAVLCFIPVTSNRYFLPCGVLAACLSAAGLYTVLEWRYGKSIAAGLIIFSLLWSASELAKANRGFLSDHVGELSKYLENELPKDSSLLVAKRIGIPPIKSPKYEYYDFGPEDTIDSLKSKGFTHILLEPRNYKNFLNKNQNKTGLSNEDFLKIKSFYESLFTQATMLRHWEKSENQYLGKELVLFSLKYQKTNQ